MKDWSNIKTVFVDLDDTIWWFTENSKVALRHVYDRFGLAKYSPEYNHFRDIYAAKNHELWDLYHYGKIEKDFLVTERFRYTLEQIGVNNCDLRKFARSCNVKNDENCKINKCELASHSDTAIMNNEECDSKSDDKRKHYQSI